MIKTLLFLMLMLPVGPSYGSHHSPKYIDIDKLPRANIEYTPVFQHKIPSKNNKNDSLRYNRNISSVYSWYGTAMEPLGSVNVYSFCFYAYHKPIFRRDSVFIHSPIQVSKDSTQFTFSLFQAIDGDELPYGDIFLTDIKAKKTISIRALKPVNGPFYNHGRSFIFAKDNTICAYDIKKKRETDLIHIVSQKPFTILGFKLLDDHKTLRVLFSNDESDDHTCTGMDIPLDQL